VQNQRFGRFFTKFLLFGVDFARFAKPLKNNEDLALFFEPFRGGFAPENAISAGFASIERGLYNLREGVPIWVG
jgi:hypothetical protein